MTNDKAKILIVEDEAMVAIVMRWTLERLGYEVCGTVATGDEAVQSAHDDQPDLILMDVHLPGAMNGIEAAKTIATARDVPFIFFTGYSDTEVAKLAAPLEPAACLMKPVANDTLADAVAQALLQRRN
ncbi:MAG: response regulator [Anaerolineae bacterium]